MGAPLPSKGFAAIARADARVLILGSLPGALSIERGQYYAHPRNGFWPILAQLVGARPDLSYAARIAALMQNGIAVWDVCESAKRAGSLDTAIEPSTVVFNDFGVFFAKHPYIKQICFNGAKAAALYKRGILPTLPANLQALPRITLPSTSPAHTMPFAQKLSQWRAALDILFS